MKLEERIQALLIASKYDIEVHRCWWSPYRNVTWKVLKSYKKLTADQYGYLSNNKLLKEKEIIEKGNIVILTISDIGKEKIIQLSNKILAKTR